MKHLQILATLAMVCSQLLMHATDPSRANVAFKTIHFLSSDGLEMTADYHEIDPNAPTIILCHQAQFSRGEYIDIAPQLNSFGFNCLAVDLRSGKSANGLVNITAKNAKERGRPTEYADAEKDILAAIEHYTSKYNKEQIILWGSSYSAALALKIGINHPKVSSVIAYSPGEYLANIELKPMLKNITIPCYVASAKKEAPLVKSTVVLSGVCAPLSVVSPISCEGVALP